MTSRTPHEPAALPADPIRPTLPADSMRDDAALRALLGPASGSMPEAADEAMPAGALDALWNATEVATQGPTGGPRRLREMRTSLRIAASFGAAAAICGVLVLVLHGRSDLAIGPALPLVAALGAVLLATLAVSLRGLHQRRLRAWQAVAAIALAVGLPVLMAVLPGAPGAWSDAPVGGLAPASCYFVGLLAAALVTVSTWLFQRATTATWQRLLGAFGAGGVAGFIVLQIHCGSVEATHVLLSHAGVGVSAAALALVVLAVRGRLAPGRQSASQ